MLSDAPANLLTEWSRLVAGVLRNAGITRVFVSPGSRSTPYLLALLETDGIECHSVIDERAAAFAALGFARATGRPAGVLCTSGTAPAHHFPAVLEACASRLPLVVLSADRARREQDRGAAQTLDQTRIFGNFATFLELGDPTPSLPAFRSAARKLASALETSSNEGSPLHVNLPADKPLEPKEATSDSEKELVRIRTSVLEGIPRVSRARSTVDVAEIVSLLEASRRPLVLGGPLRSSEARTIEALARHLGAPLLGEASGNFEAPIPAEFGLLSLSEAPDLVLHWGGPLTSSGVQRHLETSKVPRVQISLLSEADPAETAHLIVRASPGDVARALLEATPPRREWLGVSSNIERTLETELAREGSHSEPNTVLEALSGVPTSVPLLVGNSLSVRLVDWVFGATKGKRPEILVQRGVNGIDGLIASAQGARLASEKGAGVLLGDVSLAHDLTSLTLLRDERRPLVVIVLDNDGGRLFDHLPARSAVVDERKWSFFRTPPELDLESIARGFRIEYRAPESREIASTIRRAFEHPGTTLVHLRTDSKTTGNFLSRCRASLSP